MEKGVDWPGEADVNEDFGSSEQSGLTLGGDDARVVVDFAVGSNGVGPVMGFGSDDFFPAAPYADPVLSSGSRPEGPSQSALNEEEKVVTTKVEKSVVVQVPIRTVYNQWTQFREFPRFMGGVKSVTQLSDDRLEWVAEIAGVRRRWEAKILEQIPDRRIAWAATEGTTNAGAVTFEDLGRGQTAVRLSLEYEPEGLVEKVGDKLNVVGKQAEADLERFKAFIEAQGYPTGSWRGTIGATIEVGSPPAFVRGGAERPGDSAAMPPAVTQSVNSDADLGGMERAGRRQTDLGSTD
jgi:uncharacterized membrane protein